jgi:uncharacterized membrane protein
VINWMYNSGPMGWDGWMMMGTALIFCVALVAMILAVSARPWPPHSFQSARQDEDEAIASLRADFARGEIAQPEFESRLKSLQH